MITIPCAGLLAALKGAAAGAVIAVTGTCGPVTINGVQAPGVTVDLGAASFSSLAVYHSSGVTWENAKSTGALWNAITLIFDSQMAVHNFHVVGPGNSAVTVSRSDHIDVGWGMVQGSKGDGVDVSGSDFVRTHDILCFGNVETKTHPDCVQGWSEVATATTPMRPLTHVKFDHNVAIGDTQGFDVFDHFSPSNQDVEISDNVAIISLPRCVSLLNGNGGRVVGNTCAPYPGAKWAPGVDVQGSVNTVSAPNTILPLP